MRACARERLVATLRCIMESLFPGAELHVFGSYATDLFLPTRYPPEH